MRLRRAPRAIRLPGVCGGTPCTATSEHPEGPGLVVRGEAAHRQLELEAAEATDREGAPARDHHPPATSPGSKPPTPAQPRIRRFHGRVAIDPLRVGKDAAKIAEE